ncbi:hypothetical protein IQ07DRAFT_678581 [Pyrenochaeta sp. DS3sAY3a]|nr:hypothetical protein IQ07DRAFT_678581 [Pyrenochaeta sp. DS3sAY3a]
MQVGPGDAAGTVPNGGPSPIPNQRFNCDHCSKSFSRVENLARHQASYKGHQRFRCHCGKRFSRSDLLRRHQKAHVRSDKSQGPLLPSRAENIRESDPSVATLAAQSPKRPLDPSEIVSSNWSSADQFGTTELGHETYGLAMPTGPSVLDLEHNNSYSFPLNESQGLYDNNLAWVFDFPCDLYSPDQTSNTDTYSLHTSSGVDLQALDHEEAYLGVDDDPENGASEWPDRAHRAKSPSPQARPLRQAYQGTMNLLTSSHGHELRNEMAQFQSCYGEKLSQQSNNVIEDKQRLCMIQSLSSDDITHFTCSDLNVSSFPNLETLNYYLQLYLIHTDRRLPVLHWPTFSVPRTKILLLLSMVLIGSSYSKLNRGSFGLHFYERTRAMLILENERRIDAMREFENIFALLLLCWLAIQSGHKTAFARAESDRGLLVLACRRRRLLDCRSVAPKKACTRVHNSGISKAWHDWVQMEQLKRLGLSIWLFDCQFAALLNTQAYISKSEAINAVFPCDESFWTAPSANRWKLLLGPSEMPPGTYFLTTQTSVLLQGVTTDVEPLPFPALSEFSQILLVYTVHLQIFDWRQILSYLNPNGVQNSVVALGPQQMGPDLAARRDWLLRALGTWNSKYGSQSDSPHHRQSPNGNLRISPCGELVYYLGVLAIKISFADLHLLTGRSGSEEDLSLAKESLHNWLRKADVERTLNIAKEMMEIAIHAIEQGESDSCALEVSVSLFMGGLISWTSYHLSIDPDAESLENGQRPYLDRVHLLRQVKRSVQGLRKLAQCGFSRFFASVLTKFIRSTALE